MIKRCIICGKEFNALGRDITCSKNCSVVNKKEIAKKSYGERYKKEKEYYFKSSKKWNIKNPEKRKEFNIKHKFKKYGLLEKDYNKLLKKQKNRCAICNKHKKLFDKNLYIDHCHITGKVRGLLCNSCNRGIGYLADDTKLLSNAIKYLGGYK